MLKHTITCPIEGYEALELTFSLGISQEQQDTARADGNPAPALLDFPNWEAVADVLELGAKPPLPLTEDGLRFVPIVLLPYVVGDEAVNDALSEFTETRRSKSKGR